MQAVRAGLSLRRGSSGCVRMCRMFVGLETRLVPDHLVVVVSLLIDPWHCKNINPLPLVQETDKILP